MNSDYQAKKNGETMYPVTSLSWKPNLSDNQFHQELLGCTLDGGVVRWNNLLANTSEKVILNDENSY